MREGDKPLTCQEVHDPMKMKAFSHTLALSQSQLGLVCYCCLSRHVLTSAFTMNTTLMILNTFSLFTRTCLHPVTNMLTLVPLWCLNLMLMWIFGMLNSSRGGKMFLVEKKHRQGKYCLLSRVTVHFITTVTITGWGISSQSVVWGFIGLGNLLCVLPGTSRHYS